MADATVTIYTSPTCSFCQQAKAHLKEKGVAYDEKDVTEDEKNAEEAVKKSGQFGVPVIIIGDEILTGYDSEALDAVLKENDLLK